MNSYYYIGHFSKFIRPGAKRLACSSNRAILQATAFVNPDGKIAVVVMNEGDAALEFRMYVGDQAVVAASPAHSIQTLVF
jgi:glucosylceramidase